LPTGSEAKGTLVGGLAHRNVTRAKLQLLAPRSVRRSARLAKAQGTNFASPIDVNVSLTEGWMDSADGAGFLGACSPGSTRRLMNGRIADACYDKLRH
jgi:hypothetical protein